jgi:hypothetical protein
MGLCLAVGSAAFREPGTGEDEPTEEQYNDSPEDSIGGSRSEIRWELICSSDCCTANVVVHTGTTSAHLHVCKVHNKGLAASREMLLN